MATKREELLECLYNLLCQASNDQEDDWIHHQFIGSLEWATRILVDEGVLKDIGQERFILRKDAFPAREGLTIEGVSEMIVASTPDTKKTRFGLILDESRG